MDLTKHMPPSDLPYWVALNAVPALGPVRFQRLLDFFGEAQQAWMASGHEWGEAGVGRKITDAFLALRSQLDPLAELKRISQMGLEVLTLVDDNYPARLKHIYGPPPVLYLKGSLQPADEWSVAVVGARKLSDYGRQVAESMAEGLAANGLTVVSGLALGIDAVAHWAALNAKGRTLAILGCGLDQVYPLANRKLADAVVKSGALISEFHPGTRPLAQNFPARNRIISGLSLGTLVVEAAEKSGALITAHLALEQGREVFAVPGSIYSRLSRGTNHLIMNSGAKLVTSWQEVMDELNLTVTCQEILKAEAAAANPNELALLELLSDGPLHINDLSRRSGLPVAQVSSTLVMMEVRGLIKAQGGMMYLAKR